MVFKDVVILPVCCENIQTPSFLTKSKYFLVHPNIETSLRVQESHQEDKPQSGHLFENHLPKQLSSLNDPETQFLHLSYWNKVTSQHCNGEECVSSQ